MGRFRNLVTTAVISNKRQKVTDAVNEFFESLAPDSKRRIVRPEKDNFVSDSTSRNIAAPFSSVLGGIVMNAAPDIDLYSKLPEPSASKKPIISVQLHDENEPHKKKYAKEAWPGRKPTSSSVF